MILLVNLDKFLASFSRVYLMWRKVVKTKSNSKPETVSQPHSEDMSTTCGRLKPYLSLSFTSICRSKKNWRAGDFTHSSLIDTHFSSQLYRFKTTWIKPGSSPQRNVKSKFSIIFPLITVLSFLSFVSQFPNCVWDEIISLHFLLVKLTGQTTRNTTTGPTPPTRKAF